MADEKNIHPEEDIPQSNAARRLKGLGIDPAEVPTDGEETVQVGFWENFWYHHKWKTMIALFAVLLAIICTAQMCTQNSYELYILYAGPGYVTPNETRSVQSSLSQLTGTDEESNVMFSVINYMNEAQIAEKKALAEAEGVDLYIDLYGNANALERFQMEIVAGNSVICLLDPLLYASVREGGGLLPLSEILDEAPTATIDEYGIRLGDIPLYQSISVLENLPADTVLCVRKISTMAVFKGKKKAEQAHVRHVELFRQMVTFAPAE